MAHFSLTSSESCQSWLTLTLASTSATVVAPTSNDTLTGDRLSEKETFRLYPRDAIEHTTCLSLFSLNLEKEDLVKI
jgi:hypothetical protein